MPEYIDRKAFKRKLIDEKGFYPAIVARAIDEMPAADVATKTEVAREIFEELERIGLVLLYDDYDALKKKYTDERECIDCKYFVGCECFDGKICDLYKRDD